MFQKRRFRVISQQENDPSLMQFHTLYVCTYRSCFSTWTLPWRRFPVRFALNDEGFVVFVCSGLDLEQELVRWRLLDDARGTLDWKREKGKKLIHELEYVFKKIYVCEMRGRKFNPSFVRVALNTTVFRCPWSSFLHAF